MSDQHPRNTQAATKPTVPPCICGAEHGPHAWTCDVSVYLRAMVAASDYA